MKHHLLIQLQHLMHLRRKRKPHHPNPHHRPPPKPLPIHPTKRRRPPPLLSTTLDNQISRPNRIPTLPKHPQRVEGEAARPAFPLVEVQGEGQGAHRDVGVPDGGEGAEGGDCGCVGAGEEGEAAHGTVILRAGCEVREAVGTDQVRAGEDFGEGVGGPADYAGLFVVVGGGRGGWVGIDGWFFCG